MGVPFDPFDPFDVLKGLDPLADDPNPADPESHEAARMLARILEEGAGSAGSAHAGSRWRRHWRLIVGGGCVGALVAGIAAWAVVSVRQADDPLTVACYSAPALERTDIVVLTANDVGPLELCQRPWVDGTFATGASGVPPLVGCTRRDGVAMVFPGDGPQLCDQLGLDRLDTGSDPEAQAVVEFQDRVTSRLLDRGCLTPAEVAAVVREELDGAQLSGWTVDERFPFTDAEPCGSIAIEPANRTVWIDPLPRLED
jgi:hypothetical protein